jgi:hypothetical protein
MRKILLAFSSIYHKIIYVNDDGVEKFGQIRNIDGSTEQ